MYRLKISSRYRLIGSPPLPVSGTARIDTRWFLGSVLLLLVSLEESFASLGPFIFLSMAGQDFR